MQKKNVFLVSTRELGSDGALRGGVISTVVCGFTELSARAYIEREFPKSVVVGVVGLVDLERQVKLIKDVLGCTDLSLPLFIEPGLN